MSREIYKRTVAPHNFRVGADGGVPSDNVQAAILLAQDNQEWVGRDKYLCISPELFGVKTRISAPYLFATKAYSANSPQRDLGDEIVPQPINFLSGYASTGSATITANTITVTNGSFGGVVRDNTLTIGKVYRIAFKGSVTAGTAALYNSTGGLTNKIMDINASAAVFTAVSASVYMIIIAANGSVLTTTEYTIREVLNADLSQSTANSQPYLSKIAPSEPQSLLNTNGDSRFMSHSAISFAANEKWTVECVIKINYSSTGSTLGIISNTTDQTTIGVVTTSNVFRFRNESGTDSFSNYNPKLIIGKNVYCTFVANGNGTILLYVNGVYIESISVTTNFSFNRVMQGRGGNLFGTLSYISIISDAPSASRIQYRAALLRSIFAEIQTVRIAGLDVAVRALDIVCTPAGTLIPNVTDNTAWAALTTPAWAHHSNDLALGSTYGKIYNGYSRTTLKTDLASANFGYHIATKAELTAIAASGLALKAMGTSYWTTANGTNITGLTLLGGASRSETGTFNTIKSTVSFWCDDVDECFTLNDNGTYSFDAKSLKFGAYIILVKNYAGEFLYDSLGDLLTDINGEPLIVSA